MSPQTSPLDLTTIRALSFDCYGTLIDWESGLISDLRPILSQLPPSHPWNLRPLTAVEHFNTHSEHLWATKPTQLYQDNLVESLSLLASEAGVSLPDNPTEIRIGTGPSRWIPFPDTLSGLLKLQRYYKLIILSNVSNTLIQKSQETHFSPHGVTFDAIYTAEQISSYKPSHDNFHYLFEHAQKEFNIDWKKGELLHVARSLTADHVPAKELGFPSVWISRGGDKPEGYGTGGDLQQLEAQGKLAFSGRWDTIGEFADEVERQFREKEEEEERGKAQE